MNTIVNDKNTDDWPPSINAVYEKVRPLGEGAYGIVWLAKTKKPDDKTAGASMIHYHPQLGDDGVESTLLDDKDKKKDDDDSVEDGEKEDTFDNDTNKKATVGPPYVAIKQISTSQSSEQKYALREIEILKELNHPCIVRCLQSVQMAKSQLVVLTLADGPNLGELVNCGGALSESLCRLAARHLISAVAYLHGREVAILSLSSPNVRRLSSRDIKPDNCVLERVDVVPLDWDETITSSNAARETNKDDWMSNDKFWDDKAVFNDKEWKVVLVDFGFARALTPAECGVKSSGGGRGSVRNLVQRGIEKQASQAIVGSESQRSNADSERSKEQTKTDRRSETRRGSSFQRVPIRAMSALGTRAFAAPEVTKARRKSEGDAALAGNVSDYGLISDAYSVGKTIHYLLTGIPAEENEANFMSSQDNILLKIFSMCMGNKGKRKKRYKWSDETPKPARELVSKLMKPSYADRITVPLARNEPWIKGGTSDKDPVVTLPSGDIELGIDDPIKTLKCATKM